MIALELQGHGRTANIEREISPSACASDVVALLDHLGIGRARVLGHSMGAAVTVQLAIEHPTRVRSVVPVSLSVRPDGLHEDFIDPAEMGTSTRMPTAQDFADFQRRLPAPVAAPRAVRRLPAVAVTEPERHPRLDGRAAGPHHRARARRERRPDFVTLEHTALIQTLIPGSQIAVLPGTTHMQATRRADLLLPMLAAFLD